MTLADVIAQIGRFDDDLSIYAVPRWGASSAACVIAEPYDGSHPASAAGMTYLASVSEARRAVAARRQWSGVATAADVCASVIYYAVYDQLEPCLADEQPEELAIAV